MGSSISKEAALRAAVKAVNDTAGPDGLVPTLLVFGAYPRISTDSPPTTEQQQRARAVAKAMAELRKIVARKKVSEALNTRNGPNTEHTLPSTLALGSSVLAFREKGGWQGPFRVVGVTGTKVTIEMPRGPVTLRNTHIKPYYELPNEGTATRERTTEDSETEDSAEDEIIVTTGSGETQFLSAKKQQEYDLALELRREGKITAPGKPFEESDRKEIEDLLSAGVITSIRRSDAPERTRISNQGSFVE